MTTEALRTDIGPLLGGWRELIAMLDDMPKDESVGKAMWAALDQIDRVRAQLRKPDEAAREATIQRMAEAIREAVEQAGGPRLFAVEIQEAARAAYEAIEAPQ